MTHTNHFQKSIDFSSGWPFDHHPSYQAGRVASTLKIFLNDMNFVPTRLSPVNVALENYMENWMYTRGVECKQLKRTIHTAASLVEFGYHNCTFEEKTNLALLNWIAIYVDDLVVKDPLPFRDFSSRLLRRQPQLDPVLALLPEVLDRMWDFYDPMIASAIFNHTLCFLTGSCIEPELDKIPYKHGIERFPWYIRDLTGLSYGYALFGFTKTGNFDMMKVIQALPDMDFWINTVNDLLSFHKEELANETMTYIYNRAKNENKSRYETCAEIVAEIKKARQNVYTVLAHDAAALETWKTFERGYVEWHLIQERYHLRDLGIML